MGLYACWSRPSTLDRESNANLVSHEVGCFLKPSLVKVVMMMMITMIDDCDDEDIIKPKADYFKRFITRVVATDEHGRRILQGLLHLHFNQKKIRMKISMALILTMTTILMLSMMTTKCVGSKTGRRRGWGRVVLCWTSLTKTGATALLLYSQPCEDDHDDGNHGDDEGEDDDGDTDGGGGGGG